MSTTAAINSPTKLLVDCDVGTDDVTALLMLLCAGPSSGVEVAGVSVVDGNVDILNASRTVRCALQIASRPDIPVWRGADGPLVRGIVKKSCYEGHGTDGLGGFTLRDADWTNFQHEYDIKLPSDADAEMFTVTEHAASVLARIASESPGLYTVLALGPLTNIALAISLDQRFLHNIRRLVIMGGSTEAKGNASHAAEFNFHCDPEAAQIVFHASSQIPFNATDPKLIVVPWETTVDHALPWSYYDKLVGRDRIAQSKLQKFLEGFIDFQEKAGRKPDSDDNLLAGSVYKEYMTKIGWFLQCDSNAAACIIVKLLFLLGSFMLFHVTSGPFMYHRRQGLLCTHRVTGYLIYLFAVLKNHLLGNYSRGMMLLNWHNDNVANCRVVLKLDIDKVKSILEQTFV
ncbi:hypothetical protein HDU83_004632 [Entophlyctis luteolus]|nr:hypothetical protein HDU83_004632 [Entophlyctis luteolus]